jgi:hypothetical protein
MVPRPFWRLSTSSYVAFGGAGMRALKRTASVVAVAAALIVPVVLASSSAGTIWQPTSDASISWSWQLQGTPNLANNVQMYDIDGFDNTAATVAALHAQGTIAVCYIDFGSWENWRSDAALFPASVMGKSNGWPGEKWLDIRQLSVLAPIMTARMQMCVQKGFDALEPDNIDGYTNSTGFPLTATDQLNYNEWIATTAHSLGLSVGLKNDVAQTAQLEPYFDWALDEQCNQYGECGTEQVFTAANKAVFNAEYQGSTSFCAADIAAHINGVLFDLNLDGRTDKPCGGWTAPPTTTAASTTTTDTTASSDSSTTDTTASTDSSTTLSSDSSTTLSSDSSTTDSSTTTDTTASTDTTSSTDSTTSTTVAPSSTTTSSTVSTTTTTTRATTTTTSRRGSTTTTTRPPTTTTTRRAPTTTTTTRRRGH